MSRKRKDSVILTKTGYNNNSELVCHTVIHTVLQKYRQLIPDSVILQTRITKSVNFTREDFPLLYAFMEVAKRERRSYSDREGFSSCAKRAFMEYLTRHTPPNPQLTLDRATQLNELGLPVKPNFLCCVPKCNRKAKYQLRLRDYKGQTEQFNVCQRHKRWTHPTFRFVEGYSYLKEKK